uniref:Uncharacterized protein n=1 Tax=Romanomermis culicivorax TaxID=13658 RepID=A0A915KEX2_ROMCU
MHSTTSKNFFRLHKKLDVTFNASQQRRYCCFFYFVYDFENFFAAGEEANGLVPHKESADDSERGAAAMGDAAAADVDREKYREKVVSTAARPRGLMCQISFKSVENRMKPEQLTSPGANYFLFFRAEGRIYDNNQKLTSYTFFDVKGEFFVLGFGFRANLRGAWQGDQYDTHKVSVPMVSGRSVHVKRCLTKSHNSELVITSKMPSQANKINSSRMWLVGLRPAVIQCTLARILSGGGGVTAR